MSFFRRVSRPFYSFSRKKTAFLRHNSSIQKTVNPRTDLLLKILYESPVCPPVEFSEEELERHEVIHRAWQIHKRIKRDELNKQLEKQYNKMKRACAELEKTDKRLFDGAMKKKREYFPIEMRIPTETPPLEAWKYNWKNYPERSESDV
ncbi:hypothetical protein T552_00510 [Pneumocystis carinii B80]|uniref:Large ribosomal subunit protein mL40 n=1 Tax=Pneumocystis carinii (strain B80) TaxID=1408658 RepID=A0A0W4ZR04_PNEC8|nr:hypothetical protein T552_00510 [Pneumocystis carinii B80]KTW30798.1 hypothetical protein T552_00510 [Pneumocystis carinii B80]